jgi:glycosyltransferase A (GT-A) superfamily protein (DUF2064 family)
LPGSATVLVMAPGSGSARAAALSELLLQRALAAAEAVAPGSVRRAPSLADPGLPAALAALEAERVWPASGQAGPLLILWPELPSWRPAHLDAALSDFAAGCELVIGPVFDGGFYLLGLARPLPALFELEADAWQSPTAMATILAVAAQDEVTVGLLRAERALRTPEDVAAALAEPLLDEDLRGLLALRS